MKNAPLRAAVHCLLFVGFVGSLAGCYEAVGGVDVRTIDRSKVDTQEAKVSTAIHIKATSAGMSLASVDHCATTDRFQIEEAQQQTLSKVRWPGTASGTIAILSAVSGGISGIGVVQSKDPSPARDSFANVLYVSVATFAASLVFTGVYGAFADQRKASEERVSRVEEVPAGSRVCTRQRAAAVGGADVRVTFRGLDEVITFDRGGNYSGPIATDLRIAMGWCEGTPAATLTSGANVVFDSLPSEEVPARRRLHSAALREAVEKCCLKREAQMHAQECESKCAAVVNATECVDGGHACLALATEMSEAKARVADCARLTVDCLHAHRTSFEKLTACVSECAERTAERVCTTATESN